MRPQLRLLTLAVAVGSPACMPPGSGETETGDGETTEGGDPVCGDGKVESPEACDDGNTQSGDGCSPACELSGTPTQCITLLRGRGMPDDHVDVVLPLTDSFVAAGSLNMNGDIVAWVGKWSDLGEQNWLTTISIEGAETRLRDVTTDGSNGWWAAVSTSGLAELVHLDESGNVLEQTPFPDASIHRVRWIGGRLWVAGSLQDDLWLAVLENGVLETVILEDYLGFRDMVGAMEVHDDRVLVVGTLETSPPYMDDLTQQPTSDVVMIVLDLDGNELGRETVDVGPLETPRASAARGVGDRWVVAGIAPPQHGVVLQGPQIWLNDAESDWTWNSLGIFGPQQGGGSLGGILALDTGVLFAGGSSTIMQSELTVEATGWWMQFDGAGQLIWEYHATDSNESYYRETAVAIDANGRIRSAGVGWTSEVSSTLRSCIVER